MNKPFNEEAFNKAYDRDREIVGEIPKYILRGTIKQWWHEICEMDFDQLDLMDQFSMATTLQGVEDSE